MRQRGQSTLEWVIGAAVILGILTTVQASSPEGGQKAIRVQAARA
jgi:hypothetical protein